MLTVLSIPGPGEDAAAAGDLDITDDLVLTGAGPESTIVDGAQLDRVFHVDPGLKGISAELRGFTIRNGKTVIRSSGRTGVDCCSAPPTPWVGRTRPTRSPWSTASFGTPAPKGAQVRSRTTRTMTLIRHPGRLQPPGPRRGWNRNTDLGKLTLIDSTVADNTTAQSGGGISEPGDSEEVRVLDERRSRSSPSLASARLLW